jgi:neurotransmitter:Na+ symporter, NSS family
VAVRDEFSSKFGFVMAAAGSAVGLGNIWGFPTQVASNGGAAFVIVYLALTFVLAYPVLMAELLVGRYAKSNSIDAYPKVTGYNKSVFLGVWGTLTVSAILAFYSIVGGWLMAWMLHYCAKLIGLIGVAEWLIEFSLERNIIFAIVFSTVTLLIVKQGVASGIERWSVRLMPSLLALMAILIVYVGLQPGAAEGWSVFIVPDFSRVFDADLVIGAMGQAFFSLSLGVGTMLIYGSYLSKKENMVSIGAMVALVDVGVAILAGALIIPAMYVAQASGVPIFDDAGNLISGDGLVFSVLPALFDSMHGLAALVPIGFFTLLIVAALTSSISMLEVPVSYITERKNGDRANACYLVAGVILFASLIILLNFDAFFGFVVSMSTEYSQPALGFFICVVVGWFWNRNQLLDEIRLGNPEIATTLFWKVWPVYLQFICPLIILLLFYRSFQA